MIEVIWHGRGGQGAFTAARLLGAAGSLADGAYALAFPSFGPERRGAPMRAFTKLSDAPIGNRSAVESADFVVYLDDTLFGDGWEAELKPGATVLVNSAQSFADARVLSVDADGISQEILGRPIPNTVFLGVLAALCDKLDVRDAHEAIRQYMPAKLHEKNLRIVEMAFELAKSGQLEQHAAGAPANQAQEDAAADSLETTLRAVAAACADESLDRSGICIPRLLETQLDPSEYARSTCFQAGHLVSKNAGWRNVRPVIDAGKCTNCLQCYLCCPDGAVVPMASGSSVLRTEERPDAAVSSGTASCGSKPSSRAEARFVGLSPQSAAPDEPSLTDMDLRVGKNSASPQIDLDFCKGCGVCALVCPATCISMESEKEALAVQAAAGAKEAIAR